MRLNLSRYNCVHFSLSSDFTVDSDRDASIQSLMNQTATHTHEDIEGIGQRLVASFGSRSRVAGITHQVRANLTRAEREDGLSYRLRVMINTASDNLSLPPKGWRPVSQLVDSASHLFGTIGVSCDISFEYDRKRGYESRISFPIPLILQEGAEGVTHIESAQFSRRGDDAVEYRVLISELQESDTVLHSIDFDTALELNRNSIRGLLDRAKSISTRLVVWKGGD